MQLPDCQNRQNPIPQHRGPFLGRRNAPGNAPKSERAKCFPEKTAASSDPDFRSICHERLRFAAAAVSLRILFDTQFLRRL
jgi:hypothetical protein